MSDDRMAVVVAGAGVAGLEAALALRALAAEHVTVELIAPEREFAYRPLAVAEPFGIGHVLRAPLEQLVRAAGAQLRRGMVTGVDAVGKRVVLDGGEARGYDSLLLALGARGNDCVPGAVTFHGNDHEPEFAGLLERASSAQLGRLVFAMPAAVSWPLPLYELALLTAAYLEARNAGGVELLLVTPETRPLALFGPAASTAIERLLAESGIRLVTASVPQAWEEGTLRLAGGEAIEADAVVALPELEGPALAGVPQDPVGFVETDAFGRVPGLEAVYAAGDLVRLPLKQGGIAAQQADAVATAIAAAAGADVQPEPFHPVLRGLLLTGFAQGFLRAEGGTSLVDAHPLWWPPAKIVGRYLSPFLAEQLGLDVGEKPRAEGVPVEIALDTLDHRKWSPV
jgi:sulfide:quinone oxidoreductase